MKSRSFTILGLIISLIGALALILLLFRGIIGDALYSTFQVGGDYWVWGFILIPLLFVVLGIYYLYIGLKKKMTNGFITASAIVQLIALLIGGFGLFYPMIIPNELGFLITLLLGIPTSILMVVGIIILGIGLVRPKN